MRKRLFDSTLEEIEERGRKKRRIDEDEDDELIDELLPVFAAAGVLAQKT